MRSCIRCLAESVSKMPLTPVDAAAAQLLPPIVLYRRLLRVHKKLPIEMRSMGDDYVKAEFRRTRKTDNPLQLVGFLGQWKLYLDDLEQSHDVNGIGKRLQQETLEKLSPEQLGQLYELMQATKTVFGAPSEGSAEDATASIGEAGVGSQGGNASGTKSS